MTTPEPRPPPGQAHWHGATEHSHMTHLAITLGETVWGNTVEVDDQPIGEEIIRR